ncbi:MAG: hypothetical protein EPN60_13100 [Nevskiaceae bacterium]|nr:MAG: hypothetical protein EPO48_03700 [Nevskiaceae bacterium]TAM24860.1 MAG: hypothetical protein EPN60_13100 [Nevskiaceae bacterium]
MGFFSLGDGEPSIPRHSKTKHARGELTVTASYDIDLVLLSVLIAVLASYTALALAGHVVGIHGSATWKWLLGGAFAMGSGIWSMHFIGMLAYSLPIRMAYDPVLTALSLLWAVLSSGFALTVVCRLAIISPEEVDPPILVAGGVIMGAGICAMHYTGMAAMRMRPSIDYQPALFAASMLIAVSASVVALHLAFTLRTQTSGRGTLLRMAAALVMGLAISGMHYTGMAAANIAPGAICGVGAGFDLEGEDLGYAIAGLMLALLSGTIYLTLRRSAARR